VAILRVWPRFAALPAFPVVVAFFVLAVPAAALGVEGAAFVVLAVFVAYCAARPTGGWDVFTVVAAPNALAQIAHDLVGAPRWLSLVLLPIALIAAWSIDHGAPEDEADPRDDGATAAAGIPRVTPGEEAAVPGRTGAPG
jgi:hypothetical protein